MQVSRSNGSPASILELGRQRGKLSTADLQELLPIASMSSLEIARTISDLEDQGIEITVDTDLLAGRPRTPTQSQLAADPIQVCAGKSQTPDCKVGNVSTQETTDDARAGRLETMSIAIAGLIVCAAGILLVWA
ncbi:RNA polymerase sigma factor region1.1 domain-containing protein [Bradyrhizobium sp. DASA03076]|uniref:RNA polymerase sigma factor region1.1 domain-containing protein n=1 Tax=Bradyrhizobium sp. BLXBL-03 TaxID=3395916 RepID=UPI003F6EDE70